MSLDDEENTWLLALEAALLDTCDTDTLLSITRGRVLPEESRAQVWYQCLGGGSKISNFSEFDQVFDLPEQSAIRADCQSIVDSLGNAEEDKVSIVCDVESVLSHYCKSRHLQYASHRQWTDIITPLLAAKLNPQMLYSCFEEILEKYIPRESSPGSPIYHLLRLLLLYHDPQLSNHLESLKITPDKFAGQWVRTLFGGVCQLNAVLSLWDAYFQERDPFFVLYLSLVILVNARDQILSEPNAVSVVETITSLPGGLTPEDAPDFCSLARYYAMKTPNTFRREFLHSIFGSVYLSKGSPKGSQLLTGALPVEQSLCLPVSVDELLHSTVQGQYPPEEMQIGYFTVDCRPAEQYNSGHLPNAFHLDSSLMLEDISTFNTALQGLFMAQKGALESSTPGCGAHICLVGGGREDEDQLLHMVAANMLHQHTAYVSLCKGGYRAIHKELEPDFATELSEHKENQCKVCVEGRGANSLTSATSQSTEQAAMSMSASVTSLNSTQGTDTLFNKFSSVFKHKSAEMKEKLVEYITNPNGEEVERRTQPRHVSPDDTGELYRGAGDVFSIGEEDTPKASGVMKRITLSELLKKPDTVKSFHCHQVRENGYMYPCVLVLTNAHVLLVRLVEESNKEGDIVATRSLSSIMKITSKKKHPDLITFKYGVTKDDGEAIITDMDRFLIPNASKATLAVKELILKNSPDGFTSPT